jgi:hypothetical protein
MLGRSGVALIPDLKVLSSAHSDRACCNGKMVVRVQGRTRADADEHGFALHTAANDATAMGGSVTVSSPGSGGGAIFTLNISMNRAKVVQL